MQWGLGRTKKKSKNKIANKMCSLFGCVSFSALSNWDYSRKQPPKSRVGDYKSKKTIE